MIRIRLIYPNALWLKISKHSKFEPFSGLPNVISVHGWPDHSLISVKTIFYIPISHVSMNHVFRLKMFIFQLRPTQFIMNIPNIFSRRFTFRFPRSRISASRSQTSTPGKIVRRYFGTYRCTPATYYFAREGIPMDHYRCLT